MAEKNITRKTIEKLNSSHGPFGKVLDVGCGNRIYESFVLADDYIGIDVKDSGHDQTGKLVDRFFDGVNIPYDQGQFDLVLCTEVLEHALEPDMLLREIKRVLKPEGFILLTVPSMWGEHEVPYDFRRYTSYGVTKLIEDAGLSLVSLEKESKGLEAYIKLGLSEINNSSSSKIVKKISKVWLRITQLIFRGIKLDMHRIYLTNCAVIKKC